MPSKPRNPSDRPIAVRCLDPRMTKLHRVYVQIVDAEKRSKSRCCTIYGITPKQARSIIVRAIREHQERERKAG